MTANLRKEVRQSTSLPAPLRSSTGRRPVIIANLSCRDCRLMDRAMDLLPGQRVFVRPTGLEALAGIVRWSNQHEAGLEFERALHPAVAAHLARSLTA